MRRRPTGRGLPPVSINRRSIMDIRSLVRQSWHECAADFASLTWGGAPRKCWGLTLFAWIWRDARVLSRRRSFDQLNGRCARSIARVQATVVLLLDESLDLLLAPTLLALAPLAQVVIPAAWSPTCGTARRHLPMTFNESVAPRHPGRLRMFSVLRSLAVAIEADDPTPRQIERGGTFASWHTGRACSVNGHRVLPTGGHEFPRWWPSVSPRWWPRISPPTD